MDFILFRVGGIYAVLLVTLSVSLATRKITPNDFTSGDAIGAAGLAVLGWLLHLIMSWTEQNGLGWLLAVIVFLFVMFVLCSAFIGGILRFLYRD